MGMPYAGVCSNEKSAEGQTDMVFLITEADKGERPLPLRHTQELMENTRICAIADGLRVEEAIPHIVRAAGLRAPLGLRLRTPTTDATWARLSPRLSSQLR